jgi:molecular chaperone GrpE
MKHNDDKPTKKETELEQARTELTNDLQRIQADFVNYRRRVDEERQALIETARMATIMKLLPMVDDIERAVSHVPAELADNTWAKGVVSLGKRLEKSLADLGLSRIEAAPGTTFDPNLHEAVMMEGDEEGEEVISEALRAGYTLGSHVVRPTMVKVTHQLASSAKNAEDKRADGETANELTDKE